MLPLLLVLALLGSVLLAPPILGGPSLRMVKWEPMSGPPAPAYIHLEVELPCDLKEPQEEITVNGQAAAFRHLGFSSGSGRCGRDYAVYVGPPGKKMVRLDINTGSRVLSAAATLVFESRGAIVLLDRVPGEAVLEPGEWRFWGYFVRDLKVRVNDMEVPYQLRPSPVSEHHALITCQPNLRPGPNLITIVGKGLGGEAVKLECPTYYIKDQKVRLHDEILLPYGYMGSKSGPFFRLDVEGKALQPGESQDLDQAGLKDDAWYYQKRMFLKRLKAVNTGEAVLKFYEKAWFTNPFQLRKTLTLKVVS
uniref:Uncharacterized protein n=1 Tax=Desulfobacca acetoxidans TaxID=60893 RepID=A0A7C5ALE7_9BACT